MVLDIFLSYDYLRAKKDTYLKHKSSYTVSDKAMEFSVKVTMPASKKIVLLVFKKICKTH